MNDETTAAVRCDGQWDGCLGHLRGGGYIDESGFAYCSTCGPIRQGGGWKRCRKLRPHEFARLENGLQLAHY